MYNAKAMDKIRRKQTSADNFLLFEPLCRNDDVTETLAQFDVTDRREEVSEVEGRLEVCKQRENS